MFLSLLMKPFFSLAGVVLVCNRARFLYRSAWSFFFYSLAPSLMRLSIQKNHLWKGTFSFLACLKSLRLFTSTPNSGSFSLWSILIERTINLKYSSSGFSIVYCLLSICGLEADPVIRGRGYSTKEPPSDPSRKLLLPSCISLDLSSLIPKSKPPYIHRRSLSSTPCDCPCRFGAQGRLFESLGLCLVWITFLQVALLLLSSHQRTPASSCLFLWFKVQSSLWKVPPKQAPLRPWPLPHPQTAYPSWWS